MNQVGAHQMVVPQKPKKQEVIAEFGSLRVVPKGSTYIEEGQIFDKLFLVQRGILRSYYLTEDGVEKTMLFTIEGLIYGAIDCVFYSQPSTRFWHALEDVELIEIDARKLCDKSENNIELLKLRVQFLESLLMDATQRIESFVRDSSELRFQQLVSAKHDLVNRIADKQSHRILA